MAVTGKPVALSYPSLTENVVTDFGDDDDANKGNIRRRLNNHEQRIATNKEGLENVNKRAADIDEGLDGDLVDDIDRIIADVQPSVNRMFENIVRKDEPDDYRDLKEQLSDIREKTEKTAADIRRYQAAGFNADTWRAAKNKVVELDITLSAMPTVYNNVVFTNIGVLTEETASRNFDSRVRGNFAAVKGNLRCKTGDNPVTGWWFQNEGSGRGMLCNLYTLDVWSLYRKTEEDPVKFKIIFKNGKGMSDQELFPDEKILTDALMAAGMTADLWSMIIFDINSMYKRSPYLEMLKADISDMSWLFLLSDLEKAKSIVDIRLDKLSADSWKQVVKILSGYDPEMTDEERKLLRKLKLAGVSGESWYDLLVSVGRIGSVILTMDKIISFDIREWENLLKDIKRLKVTDDFIKTLESSGFNKESWNTAVRRLLNE